MTNLTKWLIAIPFTIAVVFLIPGIIAGEFFWFRHVWSDALYFVSTTGMWIAATAFVDVDKPRGKPDTANILISLALVFSVPLAVYDRTNPPGSQPSQFMLILGTTLCLLAVFLGVWARKSLGAAYSPRPGPTVGDRLVVTGPYRTIRHPMYAAAILWACGWPLLIASLLGAIITVGCVLPAVFNRMGIEETALEDTFGEAYLRYQKATWRLVPFVY